MSSYDELGRVKRKLFKGKNLMVSVSVRVNEEQAKLAYKTRIKNGLVTLSYNPAMSIVFEGQAFKGEIKEFISFALEDYIDILQTLGKVLKGLNIDDMFSRNKAGEMFINNELKIKYTEVIKGYNSNIVIEPSVVEFFNEYYEGVTFCINNGRKLEVPHFEFVKLISILHKTDLILLGEQILTNGLLLNMMEKEVNDYTKIASENPVAYLRSSNDDNKNLLK